MLDDRLRSLPTAVAVDNDIRLSNSRDGSHSVVQLFVRYVRVCGDMLEIVMQR